MDFMHDTLYHGKRFRTLNVIDEGVREALAIEVDTSLPAERVIRVLEQLKESRPLPHSSAEKISDKIFPAPWFFIKDWGHGTKDEQWNPCPHLVR
jgi:transposase InsO family protein